MGEKIPSERQPPFHVCSQPVGTERKKGDAERTPQRRTDKSRGLTGNTQNRSQKK